MRMDANLARNVAPFSQNTNPTHKLHVLIAVLEAHIKKIISDGDI